MRENKKLSKVFQVLFTFDGRIIEKANTRVRTL